MPKLNRATRRANVLAFKAQVKAGTWGEWEDQPFTHEEIAKAGFDLTGLKRVTMNDRYSVQFYEHMTGWGLVTQMVIRRHDEGKGVPWAHKQRIKDELVGSDRTAIEVFPSAEKLVDDANLFHLWVLPKDLILPFGLHLKNWTR